MSPRAMVLERWKASEIQSFYRLNFIGGLLLSSMFQIIRLASYPILPDEVLLISPISTRANRLTEVPLSPRIHAVIPFKFKSLQP